MLVAAHQKRTMFARFVASTSKLFMILHNISSPKDARPALPRRLLQFPPFAAGAPDHIAISGVLNLLGVGSRILVTVSATVPVVLCALSLSDSPVVPRFSVLWGFFNGIQISD